MQFQALSWFAEDIDHQADDDSQPDMRYTIKVFGRDITGASVSMTISNYKPFFYIRADQVKWTSTNAEILKRYLNDKLNNQVSAIKVVRRKEFWGFTNNEEFVYLQLRFHTVKGLRFANKILSSECSIPAISKKALKCVCYESNIDPYIKFMHGKDIKPCGWIKVQDGKWTENTSVLRTVCSSDLCVNHKYVEAHESDVTSPFVVASFDIECTSATGDFPLPQKTYKQFGGELFDVYTNHISKIQDGFTKVESVTRCIMYALGLETGCDYAGDVHVLELKQPCDAKHVHAVKKAIDDICNLLKGDATTSTKPTRENFVNWLDNFMNLKFPRIHGDSIIQIGITVHKHGERGCSYRHIVALGETDAVPGATVVCCETERELLLKWRDAMSDIDPDIVTGYNIFGFDFEFIVKRAGELGIGKEILKLGRIKQCPCPYVVKALTSSALGENILKYIDMQGRVVLDMMKVVMRDMKFETFKLDHVAHAIVGEHKNDVSPKDIFRLQKGSSTDRGIVAKYCIQDCELCNKMMIKLEVLANNMGMANVCLVPLSFIFMRGQGIKIFSLVLKQCRDDGFLIPVVKPRGGDTAFEGALVLEPKAGIYVDEPVTVLDFASLYPSCMISENLSHECIVLDAKYDNLPGIEYIDISYEEGNNCRFAQSQDDVKGVIPRILMKLMDQRKETRDRAKLQHLVLNDGTQVVGHARDYVGNVMSSSDYYDDFQKAVMEGLQIAYKLSSNSLYGQVGASTSAIHMKDIAACTTATGRKLINMAKSFIEEKYNGNVIYGDTDSLFVTFPNDKQGREAIAQSIQTGITASSEFKVLLKKPHDLEYEKTFWPFILLSKKRYVGNQYGMNDAVYTQKFMGIVLKRRDNANIVKTIYGGIVDTILNEQDIDKAVGFLDDSLSTLVDGRCSLDDLVISKCLKSDYKDPTKIAHKVLAERIGLRTPGNKPQVNDRLQYIFVEHPNAKALQGERIETPEFIREMKLKPDFNHYITHQLMNPILQLFAVVIDKIPGYNRSIDYFKDELARLLAANFKTPEKCREKVQGMKERYVEELLFKKFLQVKLRASRLVEVNLTKKQRTDVKTEDMTLEELKAEAKRIDVPMRSKYGTKAALLVGINQRMAALNTNETDI